MGLLDGKVAIITGSGGGTLAELCREHFPKRRPVVTPLDVVRPYLEEAWAGKGAVLPPTQDLTLYL